MHISDFDFDLPEALIAQHPPEVRGASRLLLALNRTFHDQSFADLVDDVDSGDVLVFNNTKVMKARLFGQKASGGKIEALIERVLSHDVALAHIRASKSPKEGTILHFDGGIQAQMLARRGELFELKFLSDLSVYDLLEQKGHLPLPPYIVRHADDQDDDRYQTVYAKHQGAVAAPTAGLHFTDEILAKLRAKGVQFAEVTLHVGAGTFQPVRVDNIAEHKMHSEWYSVSQNAVDVIEQAKASGKKIWSVGTTTLRAVESAVVEGKLQAGQGDTDIFITPNRFTFHVFDRLITNFHLPRSTLLMLVSAFAGTRFVRELYQHAIEQQYRFFSYGDAMVLERQDDESSTDFGN